MKNLIAIAVFLFGCQTYNGLYIDDSCTEREVELIEIAVEKLNTAVGEEIVYLHDGQISAGEDDIGSLEDRDVVFCGEDPEIGGVDMNGMHGVFDIFLRSQPDDKKLLRTIMHELGHYIGAIHLYDKKSVMYRYNNGVTEYNDSDINEFRRIL